MFTLQIDTPNDPTGLAQILRETADRIAGGHFNHNEPMRLRDSHGNTVGQFEVKEEYYA